ncbi:hypothetical protein [Actinoallomurus rhizosphaericola]|uniref:hypothetical protein n=1 Tax=Actinoallomurus rhizosphaericola TaxID=2952536 RepID=UPI0020936EB5|nr:hypothetical protein [Actinoallomurus rhizosphaericola]MCO6000186.1 hypothetical protein [Actinoallomurus rhizosphaericola]
MEQPIKSRYDTNPFNPDDHSHDNDSPPDLGNTDSPELKVAWDKRPSFNTDPTPIDEGGTGEATKTQSDAGDFSVDFDTLGSSVNTLLEKAKTLVTQYENLRKHVLNSEGTVFGQNSTVTVASDFYTSGNGGTGTWTHRDNNTGPTVFAKPAQEFAEKMNPAQQKTLQGIGASLEVLGEYIALVNHSGQVYAAADKHSLFPAPPSKKVIG